MKGASKINIKLAVWVINICFNIKLCGILSHLSLKTYSITHTS